MRSVAIAQVFGESLYRVLFFTLSLGLGLTAITCSSGPFAATYEAEPNNTEADAEYYPLGLQITGQLSLQEDLDYFAFQLSAGIFEVDVWSVESVWLEYNKIYILDSAGQIMSATDVYGEANYTQSNSQRISARISVPGKYYVVLGAGRIFDDGSAYHFDSPYAFIARLDDDEVRASAMELEQNDTVVDAILYPQQLIITGQLSLQEDLDYFAFQLSAGIFEVDVWSVESVWLEYNKIYILDSAGQIMSATDVYGEANYTQSNSQRISARISVPGKYYVVLGAGRIFDDGSAYHFDSPYAFIARLHADNDRDGLPDYIDVDDDNDNIEDLKDAFPFDSEEWLDTDGDGVGNNADNDDDNDGRRDSVDPNPLVNEGPIMTVINTILLDAE